MLGDVYIRQCISFPKFELENKQERRWVCKGFEEKKESSLGALGLLVGIYYCPPAELQTFSASWVFSLAASFGILFSIYWLTVSHGCFDPFSNKDQSIYTLVFHLELLVVCEFYLGYSELLG